MLFPHFISGNNQSLKAEGDMFCTGRLYRIAGEVTGVLMLIIDVNWKQDRLTLRSSLSVFIAMNV